jgi:hypothetical protein
VLLAGLIVIACGDDDRTSPTPVSGAALVIENFTATSMPGPAGTFNFRASLRLRETAGIAATLTGVSLTLTQPSGVTPTREVAPAEAFPAAVVAANGTLDSNTLSVTNAPVQDSQLSVRITFRSSNGATRTVQATTIVTSG